MAQGTIRTVQVTFDAADPEAIGRFWAAVLGYVAAPPPEGFESWDAALAAWGVPEEERHSAYAIVDPTGAGPRMYFQKVPEAKSAKNRLHLDVNCGGGSTVPLEERRNRVHAEVERLVSLGAVRLAEIEDEWSYAVVMQDPERNEFCLQ